MILINLILEFITDYFDHNRLTLTLNLDNQSVVIDSNILIHYNNYTYYFDYIDYF